MNLAHQIESSICLYVSPEDYQRMLNDNSARFSPVRLTTCITAYCTIPLYLTHEIVEEYFKIHYKTDYGYSYGYLHYDRELLKRSGVI